MIITQNGRSLATVMPVEGKERETPMSNRYMLRYEVEVNDEPQTLDVQGSVLHVAAIREKGEAIGTHKVEFWAEGDPNKRGEQRTFQVFGTGHQIPDGAVWRGTADRTPEGLVWHLFELTKGA